MSALLTSLSLLMACPSASWEQGLRDATAAWSDESDDPAAAVRLGELTLLVERAPHRAAELFRAAIDRAPAGAAPAQRAALGLAAAAAVLDHPELLAGPLARELAHTTDPHTAEALARASGGLLGAVAAAHEPDGPLVAALQTVARRPGAAWEPARAEAARRLVAAARLAHGPRGERDAGARAGFVMDWRLSGPWGDVPELDLLRPLGPETRALAAAELTGRGFDHAPSPTWRGTFTDGEVTFFDLGPSGGVGFAEAVIAPPAAEPTEPTETAIVVRLETNRSARLFANGVEVFTLDRFRSAGPSERAAVLRTAGPLRLTVKLATADGRGFFRVQVTPLEDPDARVTVLARDAPIGSAPVVLPAPIGLADLAPDLTTPGGAMARALNGPDRGAAAVRGLAVLEALAERPRRDPDAARAALDALEAALPGHPALALEAARLARLDPRLPEVEQRRVIRAAWDRTLAAWPDNTIALRGLASLEVGEERHDSARLYLRRARAAHPEHIATAVELMRLDRSRGFEAEALVTADVLEGSLARGPHVGAALLEALAGYGYVDRARDVAERVEALFPGAASVAFADLDGAAGAHTARAERLDGAWTLEPQRHELLRGAVAAWRAAGDFARAGALLDRFLGDRPHDAWGLGERARLALEAGDLEAAAAALARALDAHPDFAPIASLAAWIAGRPEELDAVDEGREIVRRWHAGLERREARAELAAFPVVTLHDARVIDVRSDGSALELTHRVYLIQTRAGADSLGDFRPPGGARLLAARTIKADGRVLWPERTRGKVELSFPELEAGDAIEVAWVERARVEARDGGYLSAFIFGGFDAPVLALLAEARVAPGLEVRWNAFGAAPEPTHRERSEAGGEVVRWELTDLPAIPREPHAIGARGFFPFVDLHVARPGVEGDAGAWSSIATAYAGRLARLTSSGPRLAAIARDLARGAGEDERARRAFTWVKEELDESERFNVFESSAEAAVVAGKGNRALVLRALAADLGLAAEVLLCAPERDGAAQDVSAPTPNPNRFFYPVVRLGAGDAAVHLDASRPYAPFDLLPFELYGARCLALERTGAGAGPLFVTLPEGIGARANEVAWHFDVDLTLEVGGGARGSLSGSGFGPASSGLRHAWANADEPRQRLIWQQWAATLFPGARVEADRVWDMKEPDRPARWRLDLAVGAYAGVEGVGLVVGPLVKPLLGADLGGVPELAQLVAVGQRKTPLRVVPHVETSRVTLRAPSGWAWASTPPALAITLGPHRFEQRATVTEGRLEVTRAIRLAPGRVDPGDYPAFHAAVQDAIRAFDARARLAPNGSQATVAR